MRRKGEENFCLALSLSLISSSDSSSLQFKTKRRGADGPQYWPLLKDEIENQLTCCGNCSIKFESEARGIRKASSRTHGSMITSTLPSWLQQYREEKNRATNNDQDVITDTSQSADMAICEF